MTTLWDAPAVPVCRYKAEAERIVKDLHTQLDRLLADQTQTDDRAKTQVGPAVWRRWGLLSSTCCWRVLHVQQDFASEEPMHIRTQDSSSPACG